MQSVEEQTNSSLPLPGINQDVGSDEHVEVVEETSHQMSNQDVTNNDKGNAASDAQNMALNANYYPSSLNPAWQMYNNALYYSQMASDPAFGYCSTSVPTSSSSAYMPTGYINPAAYHSYYSNAAGAYTKCPTTGKPIQMSVPPTAAMFYPPGPGVMATSLPTLKDAGEKQVDENQDDEEEEVGSDGEAKPSGPQQKSTKASEAGPSKPNGPDTKDPINIVGNMTLRDNRAVYKCDWCKEKLNDKTAFYLHMKKYCEFKVEVCELCLNSFRFLKDLRAHKRNEHGGIYKMYRCTSCDFVTKSIAMMKLHLRKHVTSKPFICALCSEVYTDESEYTKHKSTHTVRKRFSCDQCDKTFQVSTRLASHMAVHTGEMPYQCTTCNKEFQFATHLRTHRLTECGWSVGTEDPLGEVPQNHRRKYIKRPKSTDTKDITADVDEDDDDEDGHEELGFSSGPSAYKGGSTFVLKNPNGGNQNEPEKRKSALPTNAVPRASKRKPKETAKKTAPRVKRRVNLVKNSTDMSDDSDAEPKLEMAPKRRVSKATAASKKAEKPIVILPKASEISESLACSGENAEMLRPSGPLNLKNDDEEEEDFVITRNMVSPSQSNESVPLSQSSKLSEAPDAEIVDPNFEMNYRK